MNITYEIPAYRDKKVAYSQTNQTYSYFLLLSGSRCWTRRRKSVIGSVNWRPRLLKDWKKIKKPTTELLRYTCVNSQFLFSHQIYLMQSCLYLVLFSRFLWMQLCTASVSGGGGRVSAAAFHASRVFPISLYKVEKIAHDAFAVLRWLIRCCRWMYSTVMPILLLENDQIAEIGVPTHLCNKLCRSVGSSRFSHGKSFLQISHV